MSAPTQAERRVWELLTRDFRWRLPPGLGVGLRGGTSAEQPVKLQVFEVVVAAIFARLRPDYDWFVTPNQPDGGLDFWGRQPFLEDETLGIAAAITVGGQCKKRSGKASIVEMIGGSLINLSAKQRPTFFVVALSAPLSEARIRAAKKAAEDALRLHCHILDRRQIEALIREHLPVLRTIVEAALPPAEIDEVITYFESGELAGLEVGVSAPTRVLAGMPFTVSLTVRSASVDHARVWWRPGPDAESVALLSPIDAGGRQGAALRAAESGDDPLVARRTLELISYAVGERHLGEVRVGDDAREWTSLGSARLVENVRPRFFERPFQEHLSRLARAYDRALAAGLATVGVVGAGGSGKSRLCEEFALERRRRGAAVVWAKQAKTLDDPHRLFADLFTGLVEDLDPDDPGGSVIGAVRGYDPDLADRADTSIRSLFPTDGDLAGTASEQLVRSALVVLIAARMRRAPLILHLQDLHWCSADVLVALERLLWQLEIKLADRDVPARAPETGVLVLLEGRERERQQADGGWLSDPFEAVLQKLGDAVVEVAPLAVDERRQFIARLFENRYSAHPRHAPDLLGLQDELIERIDAAAGGNPFHTLQHVQLLKDRRAIGQNPATGLLYLIQPEANDAPLPESVREAIGLRWASLTARTPGLALLVWSVGLLDDRIPLELFRLLLAECAPGTSFADVEATGILWTDEGRRDEVVYRHEHYFRTIRQFEVSPVDRERVVTVYVDWLEAAERPGPADLFRWARCLLALPEPEVERAQALLRRALHAARELDDVRLARRICAASLDLTWKTDERSPCSSDTFLGCCEEDLELTRELLASDRAQAAQRLRDLKHRIAGRDPRTDEHERSLQWLQLTAAVVESQVQFNDRKPAQAAEVAARAVRDIQALQAPEALEMEGLYAHGVALALSGEIDEALRVSEQAVALAERVSSPLVATVLATHANILLARDPARSEALLRERLAEPPASAEARDEVELNLGMALLLRAHRGEPDVVREAEQLLRHVFMRTHRLGLYPDAGAAALLIGIARALRGEDDEVAWFVQAVAAASRGRQMETLWRAHINLAAALHRQGRDGARDHAHAALTIMEETLAPFAEPERSPRFALLWVPLLQAVRFLRLADDPLALTVLERYPTLRAGFADPVTGIRSDQLGAPSSHEWLQIGDEFYVLY